MTTPLILTPKQVFEVIPQQPPFRFVDEITTVDELTISGRTTFHADLEFYKGHFPGNPVTPGVILLEAMCQVGIVALGIFLFAHEGGSIEEANRWTTFFADAEKTEFFKPVAPGTTVRIKAERIFWRRHKLRAKIEMTLEDGTLVAQTIASGIGIRDAHRST